MTNFAWSLPLKPASLRLTAPKEANVFLTGHVGKPTNVSLLLTAVTRKSRPVPPLVTMVFARELNVFLGYKSRVSMHVIKGSKPVLAGSGIHVALHPNLTLKLAMMKSITTAME